MTPENFWNRMIRPTDCLLFDGAQEQNGYGYVQSPFDHGPKYLLAHRLAWILTFGPIPDGLQVLHKCDVRQCCNPEHLFLGTQKDNMEDRLSKGRDETACLKPDQVREARLLLGTMKKKDIAEKFGVKRGVIYKLAQGKTYQRIA